MKERTLSNPSFVASFISLLGIFTILHMFFAFGATVFFQSGSNGVSQIYWISHEPMTSEQKTALVSDASKALEHWKENIVIAWQSPSEALGLPQLSEADLPSILSIEKKSHVSEGDISVREAIENKTQLSKRHPGEWIDQASSSFEAKKVLLLPSVLGLFLLVVAISILSGLVRSIVLGRIQEIQTFLLLGASFPFTRSIFSRRVVIGGIVTNLLASLTVAASAHVLVNTPLGTAFAENLTTIYLAVGGSFLLGSIFCVAQARAALSSKFLSNLSQRVSST
ncbi:MAG: hypothetical protein COT74_04850 [Bdellovibrionales bacterium CG10_big_fil_rev_8_21_14_0_10_45_34]|nr:MAG: hypothetical protein COT74_04850 [Bdellovibrionales bacterium CG10_big_fil_rev_8_21_14_0_10_45_34]